MTRAATDRIPRPGQEDRGTLRLLRDLETVAHAFGPEGWPELRAHLDPLLLSQAGLRARRRTPGADTPEIATRASRLAAFAHLVRETREDRTPRPDARTWSLAGGAPLGWRPPRLSLLRRA